MTEEEEGPYRMVRGGGEEDGFDALHAPSVYPNPASKHLNIRYASAEGQATISIYDLMGRMVLPAPLQGGETTLDISSLPAASYLWRILDNGVEMQRGKFVKE